MKTLLVTIFVLLAAASAVVVSLSMGADPAGAAGRTVIDSRVRVALDQMFAQLPGTPDIATLSPTLTGWCTRTTNSRFGRTTCTLPGRNTFKLCA